MNAWPKLGRRGAGLAVVCTIMGGLVCLPAVEAAAATASAAAKKKQPSRRGGQVHEAWPAKGARGRPHGTVGRWLAGQVGPRRPRARGRRAARALAARVSATAQAPSSGVRFEGVSERDPLRLVRSYEIPRGDPSCDRLLNVSWTYDSALVATAFTTAKDRAQAEQLLDQLAALQRTDGSIDFAYNTYTGAGVDLYRSGTVAWVGLAATLYEQTYRSSRYRPVATGAARWLLDRQVADRQSRAYGLLTGGPGVAWVSTQHNLVASLFLRNLATISDSGSRSTYSAAADRISAGIDRHLLVRTPGSQSQDDDNDDSAPSSAYFKQGLDDDVRPLDAQTLGIMHLIGRERTTDARAVRAYVDAGFAVSGRSIVTSPSARSFNLTYSAPGPFAGYRPYAGASGPDVLWMEGTAQMRMARTLLGESTRTLDAGIDAWGAVTRPRGEGPLGADRTVIDHSLNEYHVWPTSAAAGWTMLSYASGGRELFDAD